MSAATQLEVEQHLAEIVDQVKMAVLELSQSLAEARDAAAGDRVVLQGLIESVSKAVTAAAGGNGTLAESIVKALYSAKFEPSFHVAAPNVTVESPSVNVHPPTVNVAAPEVTLSPVFNVPEAPPAQVVVQFARRLTAKFSYNKAGQLESADFQRTE